MTGQRCEIKQLNCKVCMIFITNLGANNLSKFLHKFFLKYSEFVAQ